MGGGAFTLCILNRGGAYDRRVVLLTERRCSYMLVFVRRGAYHSSSNIVRFYTQNKVRRGLS